MKAFYCDHFVLPLPEGHRFPMEKYRLLRERLLTGKIIAPDDLIEPQAVTEDDLRRAHDPRYVQRVLLGQLTDDEICRLGFPWSSALVERSKRSSGGTLAACRAALNDGFAANLAGGTHHAGYNFAEGFCIFNDSAVAIRALQAEGLVRRALIVDCDVHQGNGTADIFRDDESVYTFSIHGEKNFPLRKVPSRLDIGLGDGTGDEEYLAALERGLEQAINEATTELVIYLAGADPYEGDRLGRLKVTKAGLVARDRMVLDKCQANLLPVAITMAGGYAPIIEDIVEIQSNTIREAAGRQAALNSR
ncbi:MAG TPA: histone deacetylase [Gemmatales bacterium]|nr:histone deacetylase [Gemmatales bacterium]